MKLSFCPKCSTTERPVCDSCAQELLDIYDKHNAETDKEKQMNDPMETYTEEMFDEWLDETYPTYEIAGVSLYPSQVLYKVDPIAYRIAYNDWVDYKDEEENE